MECVGATEERRATPQRPPPPNLRERGSFSHFKKLCTKAHQHVGNALSLDEEGKENEARDEYLQGLHLVDLAMAIESGTFKPEEKDSSVQMLQKLNKTKLQIEYRLQAIDQERNAVAAYPNLEERIRGDAPPSYEEAMSPGHVSPEAAAMMEIGDSIMNAESQDASVGVHPNAEQLYQIPDGVQIFFITPEGYVSAPSYPSSLSVYRFKEGTLVGDGQCPPSFMQVNDWVYPLIPGTSPALRTTYGAYMFPNTASDVPGAAVGLMLPDNIDAGERQKFEEFLKSLTVMEVEGEHQAQEAYSGQENHASHPSIQMYPQVPPSSVETTDQRNESRTCEHAEESSNTTSGKISKGILVAADWISWGVGKGAEKASELIKFGSNKLQGQLSQEENPRPVNRKVQKGAMYARQATNVAVKVSSFVVTKLSDATASLGRQMAPHIRKQGEKIFPKVFKKSEDGSSKIDGVLDVAASGLKGFATVYHGLEASAKALAKSLANETVHVVNHKYGQEAGQLTENSLYSVGNVAMTAYNADNIGIKAIAKRAAKDTGKAVLTDWQETRSDKQSEDKQNRISPNEKEKFESKRGM